VFLYYYEKDGGTHETNEMEGRQGTERYAC